MHRNYFLVIVVAAIFCLIIIFISLGHEINQPVTKSPSETPPPLSPFNNSIAGVGIVEASSGNIFIGSPLNRVISDVLVKDCDHVKKGTVLFRFENRDLFANLDVEKANLSIAQSRLKKLQELPRHEDLYSAQANVDIAKIALKTAKSQYEMVLDLPDPRAISQEEKNSRFAAYQQAQAKLEEGQAEFEKIKDGTWGPDLEIARNEVDLAQANVNRIKVEIQRTIVRSPIDGTVLQVNIHPGELPSNDSSNDPMMILGNIDELNLRVSINQLDVPYFRPNAPAVAFLQDNAKIIFPLEFLRIEPVIVGKKNVTNELTEKVDTRVLQILYRIKKDDNPAYVGQQLDAFIEIVPSSKE